MKKNVTREIIWDTISDIFSDTVRNRIKKLHTLCDDINGLVLADDVISLRNIPHFTASAVDGYALSSSKTKHASPATPSIIEKEEYIWVNTGMEVPENCDCVLMVEDSTLDEERLNVYEALPAGKNLRTVGEDVYNGQIIARKGDIVTPYLASLIPAAGVAKVSVFPKVRTVFIPTGDEIIDQSEWILTNDQLKGTQMESNSIMLKDLFYNWGFPLDILPVVPDDPEELESKIDEASSLYDIILVGAGSAKGRKDHLQSVLSNSGTVLYHWTLMKPGRPALMAEVKGRPVVGMPGFPMSTAVSAWSTVFPLLSFFSCGRMERQRLLQRSVGAMETLENVTLITPHSSPSGIEEWLRIKAFELDGRKAVFPISGGSSKMFSMSEMDGLSLLPQESLEFPKGSSLPVVWLTRNIDWERRALYQGSNDPAFDRIISFVRDRNGDIITRYVGSMGGLAALARKEAHFAAAHLLDPLTGTYNDTYIRDFAGDDKWERILLFYREQGIIVKKGNPVNIKGIVDLADKEVLFVNRQPGAGTRVLLDHYLTQKKIDPSSITGYENCSISHFDAANQVKSGNADVTLGIRSAALAMDLDFIALAEEPFELVIPDHNMDHPAILALIDAIQDKEWKDQVIAMGGYRWRS